MASRYARTRDTSADFWPGFVDALATLVLVITLLMTLFMLAKFFQDRFVDTLGSANERLKDQIAELSRLLDMEQREKNSIVEEMAELQASLSTQEAFIGPPMPAPSGGEDGAGDGPSADEQISGLRGDLDRERRISASARAQVELLNRQLGALRKQIESLQAALDVAEERDADNKATIADLGKRLNTALARKVQELAQYRSEFFGRLREVMGERDDVQIVGDRFVFQSEVLFPSGRAAINQDGQAQLRRLAAALIELEGEIPSEIDWVLRIDGHTDAQPIRTQQFPNNWFLSAARAISVVEFLRREGVPAQRLVAAGFGQYQPIAQGDTPEAYRRNRRIELKLTEK